jgi:CubicO group peptidase (beta-lactamase class C family)
MRFIIFLFLFFVLAVGCGNGDTQNVEAASKEAKKWITDHLVTDARTARIEEVFRRKVQHENFNGNVLIAQKGNIIYRASFGKADFERDIPLTINTKFQLASVSKQMTAIAILKLVQDGKLSVQDSVVRFFPDFPYKDVTVHSLLCHRSGVPNYIYVYPANEAEANPPTNAQLMTWFAKEKPDMYNKANTSFGYCNSNYAVLAAIVEQVSGLGFETYMRKQIFEPLGMMDTWVTTSANESLDEDKALGHDIRKKPYEPDMFDRVTGDKGVYSTIDDLYMWYRMLQEERFLTPNLYKEAFTPRSFEKRGVKNYGYGFRLLHDAVKKHTWAIYHHGWWKGFNTLFYMSPDDDFVIIILGNRYSKTVYNINPLLEILQNGKSDTQIDED